MLYLLWVCRVLERSGLWMLIESRNLARNDLQKQPNVSQYSNDERVLKNCFPVVKLAIKAIILYSLQPSTKVLRVSTLKAQNEGYCLIFKIFYGVSSLFY